VVRVGETLPGPGLWLLDSVPDADGVAHGISNPNDTEGIIDLIAAGCHVVCFVTGRGSLIGGPIAPVVKVCANAATIARLGDDFDHDASPILRGEEDYAAGGARLLARVAAIAGGMPSRAEALGHHEYLIPYKHQHGRDACRM
jgi:altronate hydrolase